MIQFKIKPTIVTIYGAQVQIKAITPATKDDAIELFTAISVDIPKSEIEGLTDDEVIKKYTDINLQTAAKLQELDSDGVIKRLITNLTNLTDEDVLATPYFVQAEILAYIYKENIGLFLTAQATMGTILSQTTPQSSKS